MIRLTQRLTETDAQGPAADVSLTLPIDARIKSRLKVTLDDGRAAGLFLPRGQLLRGGDILTDEGGQLRVEIRAATETVSTVRCSDPLLLARACYHLGNRHVPLQIEAGFARYQHDHVLDDMVQGLGLSVSVEQAPFEPESGAYQSQAGAGHHHHAQEHAHHHHHHAEPDPAPRIALHGHLKLS